MFSPYRLSQRCHSVVYSDALFQNIFQRLAHHSPSGLLHCWLWDLPIHLHLLHLPYLRLRNHAVFQQLVDQRHHRHKLLAHPKVCRCRQPGNFVPFSLFLLQMFIYYTFTALESYALAVLAYDRLIAICFPLQQNSINTLLSMSTIVVITWSFALGATRFATGILTRLSFCKSVRVMSYFCDYAPVFRLACNDNRLQWTVASTLTMVTLILPFTFIILS